MRNDFVPFVGRYLKNLFEAITNIFIFLPYFFSVTNLIETFFSPWKNIYSKKTGRGWSAQEFFSRVSFNTISRLIGVTMRSQILLFFLLLLFLYIISLPFIVFFALIILPLAYLFHLNSVPESIIKQELKNRFIRNHLLEEINQSAVESWFESYYTVYVKHRAWWQLNNLLSYPPLARDWAAGYTPTVDEFAEDLTTHHYQNRIKSAFDRQKEIRQIETILTQSQTANVVIVGEEGVGKHTIVDSLAKKIFEGKINSLLAYKRVLKLNLEKILNQYLDQKQRENFLETLFEEIVEAKNVILLIEQFDRYLTNQPGGVDLSIPIIKFARSSRLQIIGITTPFFYQKIIYPNNQLTQLFQKVDVYEISKDDALQILLNQALQFEKRYQLIIPFETVKNIIEKSAFFITDIPFPEKAIALLDHACVTAQSSKRYQLLPEVIDQVLTEKTHIPTSLTPELKDKLLQLESLLKQRILQQAEPLEKLASALRRSFLLLGKRKKPLASFLFLGPTGVGKTETAKAIADIFFSQPNPNQSQSISSNQNYLIRFDMSNYQSKADIPHLIGSADTNFPGLLTKAIREQPYGALLLDEIEKAHPDLLNIFLTILDEGYFTDGFGKRVDCKNLIIIATSNAASDLIYKNSLQSPINNQQLINYLVDSHLFSPEFLNRFDDIIVYQPLTPTTILAIAKQYVNKIADDIATLHQVKLSVSDSFIDQLINNNYNAKFGARQLERLIRDAIEDQVAKRIFSDQAKKGSIINI